MYRIVQNNAFVAVIVFVVECLYKVFKGGNKVVRVGFGLLNSLEAKDETEYALKNYYQSWKMNNKLAKASFTTLDNAIKEAHLSDIDGSALKLYLYFAIHASNDYGESWHSIQRIADFFKAQPRTVNNWIKTLVGRDLIYREQKDSKSHTTYLIPYSNTLLRHRSTVKRDEDNQSLLDETLYKIEKMEFLYGKITKVFHIFQWKNSKGKPDKSDNTQLLFIISERKNGILIGHICPLKKSGHFGVSELNIETHSTFMSNFTFDNRNVQGIALSHDLPFNRKSSTAAVLELLEHLNSIEGWQLEEFPKVTYGLIDEVLIDEPVVEESIEEDIEQNAD